MKIRKSCYVKGAATYGQCLVSDIPQIAVAGKSNVGKSSFINFLAEDGQTCTHFKTSRRHPPYQLFLINGDTEEEFLLADLPGTVLPR